jgi:putative sigma-54 modulation protein
MNVHLVLRQLQLTEAIRAFTEEKLTALEHICPDMQSADVILAQNASVNPAKRFTITVRLAVPGKDIHASETAGDLYAAIDVVQNKLARRLRKRKTRFESARRKLQRMFERLRMSGAPGAAGLAAI